MNRIAAILLAALPLLPFVGCEDSDPEPSEDATGTGEPVGTSSESGDVVEDSSSSGSEESTGDEGSGSTYGSESSTGEPFMGEPDPQPEDGMLSPCDEQTALSCQLSLQCLTYEGWQAGFCTDSCHTVETCAANDIPKSGATLACAPVSSLSYKYCVLACDDDAQCPSGMACTQLPVIPANEPIQRVCV